MKIGVVVFPGSNCDHDAYWAIKHNLGINAEFLFHKEHDLKGCDAIILPGGFSYGDYLRSGAIARFSPIMKEVIEFANSGGLVIGICNGFQILCESGLLPGALLRNRDLRFISKFIHIRIERGDTIFTGELNRGDVLRIPIAHGEGNYHADKATLQRLEENDQIIFTYCDPKGNVSEDTNPNGSQLNIAGIVNEAGNVLGMMPHPERACDSVLGSTDGVGIFRSLITAREEVAV
ncbi:MAG: phosphoribosylformylglycinamidine synthase subunit PurQ [Chlorobi bacterium]|nr:phosphoribosylformylglycinamidine synthase subunit PurQ [Chlorobiota bacterium]